MVEAEPDDGEVEPEELAVAECFRVFVPWHAEVAVERDHLIFGKALSEIINGDPEDFHYTGSDKQRA